mmetsp:Transcript_151072/g.263279  ORF Transcript_151072/g.263279 Transcript_151072/m.263279 type:complete len:202 (-) Transcript_151072:91-696(-)
MPSSLAKTPTRAPTKVGARARARRVKIKERATSKAKAREKLLGKGAVHGTHLQRRKKSRHHPKSLLRNLHGRLRRLLQLLLHVQRCFSQKRLERPWLKRKKKRWRRRLEKRTRQLMSMRRRQLQMRQPRTEKQRRALRAKRRKLALTKTPWNSSSKRRALKQKKKARRTRRLLPTLSQICQWSPSMERSSTPCSQAAFWVG